MVLRDASPAMRLDSFIYYLQRHSRCDCLDHCDLFARLFASGSVHHPRGFENQQPRLIDRKSRIGDPMSYDSLIRNRFAERDAFFGALAH